MRRYLYASMQVGRAPIILGDPIARGWCSSRPVRTFEDAVIFVLDVEKCLNQLGSLDRMMLSRIVLQEYTQAEAATLLGMGVRTISYKFPAGPGPADGKAAGNRAAGAAALIRLRVETVNKGSVQERSPWLTADFLRVPVAALPVPILNRLGNRENPQLHPPTSRTSPLWSTTAAFSLQAVQIAWESILAMRQARDY